MFRWRSLHHLIGDDGVRAELHSFGQKLTGRRDRRVAETREGQRHDEMARWIVDDHGHGPVDVHVVSCNALLD